MKAKSLLSLTLFTIILATGLHAQTLWANCGGCEATKTCGSRVQDVVDTAISAGQFKTLIKAVQAADLVDTLKSDGPFTVFAPTDAAFAKLPKGTLSSLLKPENKKQLQAILTFHVVKGKILSNDLLKHTEAQSLQGGKIAIDMRVNNARIAKADIACSNGVIHVIDSVILPDNTLIMSDNNIVQTAVKAGQFNTLAAALQAAGLVDALQSSGPFTLFAPTDDAFAKLPEGILVDLLKPEKKEQLQAILKYHVVGQRLSSLQVAQTASLPSLTGQSIGVDSSMQGVYVNQAKVVKADIQTSNGVIHVIDQVILLNDTLPGKSIVEAAAASGSFKTLLAAAKAAGLVDALKAKGPMTLFAPTDAAFAKLPAGTIESLLKPENKGQLLAILKHHVVEGRITSWDILPTKSAETLQGQSIRLSLAIDNAAVTRKNIHCSNGVIHVIDEVILPTKKVSKL